MGRSEGEALIVRGRSASRLIVAAWAALLLTGCAESKLVSVTVKSLEKEKPKPGYKVGKPYQVGGVWYYPAEDFN